MTVASEPSGHEALRLYCRRYRRRPHPAPQRQHPGRPRPHLAHAGELAPIARRVWRLRLRLQCRCCSRTAAALRLLLPRLLLCLLPLLLRCLLLQLLLLLA